MTATRASMAPRTLASRTYSCAHQLRVWNTTSRFRASSFAVLSDAATATYLLQLAEHVRGGFAHRARIRQAFEGKANAAVTNEARDGGANGKAVKFVVQPGQRRAVDGQRPPRTIAATTSSSRA